jgi:hypothetical protein
LQRHAVGEAHAEKPIELIGKARADGHLGEPEAVAGARRRMVPADAVIEEDERRELVLPARDAKEPRQVGRDRRRAQLVHHLKAFIARRARGDEAAIGIGSAESKLLAREQDAVAG